MPAWYDPVKLRYPLLRGSGPSYGLAATFCSPPWASTAEVRARCADLVSAVFVVANCDAFRSNKGGTEGGTEGGREGGELAGSSALSLSLSLSRLPCLCV